MRRCLREVFFFAFCLIGVRAFAHDPGLSSAAVTIYSDRIEAVTTFAVSDARWLAKSSLPEGAELEGDDAVAQALVGAKFPWWTLTSTGTPLKLLKSRVATLDGNLVCKQEFVRPNANALEFRTRVFSALPPGHREHFTLQDTRGVVLVARLLSESESQASTVLPVSTPVGASAAPSAQTVSFAAFLALGVEHILTGYDHLLFLFAFLISAQRISSVFKIVTSFTVAHSITLGLSAFNLVSIPSRWVEPAIAATIVFVAVQNLLRRERPSERVALTFLFGLIHGFGFAAVLRDLGIADLGTSAWRALAGFNLGVEVGQVAVASTVLPILWWLRARKSYEFAWRPAMSGGIALAGAYWLVQRIGSA